MNIRRVLHTLAIALIAAAPASAAPVLVEAESFSNLGGWVVDQQSIDAMGSSYLLAHGLGTPVADAATTVAFPQPGEYRVFVRTKDWVARWNAPGAPGKFQVLINSKPLAETFGTKGADWSWHDGGTVAIAARQAAVALHDLTGFEGRCDAIAFIASPGAAPPNEAAALAAFRRQALGLPDKPADAGQFDVVVVGGGVAGCCAAVVSARLGLKVGLVQDRPVVGGNSSSEVRVWIQGKVHQGPFPLLGEIVDELNTRAKQCPGPPEIYGDDVKMNVLRGEPNLTLFLNEHVTAVETDAGRIRAVISQNVLTGRESRYLARWFIDSTGDADVGFLAGADLEVTPKGHLGASNLWIVAETGGPSAFPRCPWAYDLTDKAFPTDLKQLGQWFWESGFDHDTVLDAEAIRDNNFRGMYGAWDCLKNSKGLYPNHQLTWAAYVSGRRESRRLLGDVVLAQDDVLQAKEYPDGCVPATWNIDLHYPNPKYAGAAPPGDEFLSVAKFTPFKAPYAVPYRCFYSRSIPNLFMAGRNASVTHEALGTVRVMATGGMMGEVAGRAAYLCKRFETDPRAIYDRYWNEMKELLQRPLGRKPAVAPPSEKPAAPAVELKNPLEGKVGENVARAAKVATSSDAGAAAPAAARLTDGVTRLDNALRWISTPGVPNWVELEWDGPKTLAAARVISGYVSAGSPGDPITDFVFQAFDGRAWRDIPGTRTAGNTAVDWSRTFAPVTTKRVRLFIEKSKSDTSRIWELELYAPPSSE